MCGRVRCFECDQDEKWFKDRFIYSYIQVISYSIHYIVDNSGERCVVGGRWLQPSWGRRRNTAAVSWGLVAGGTRRSLSAGNTASSDIPPLARGGSSFAASAAAARVQLGTVRRGRPVVGGRAFLESVAAVITRLGASCNGRLVVARFGTSSSGGVALSWVLVPRGTWGLYLV